MTFPVVCRESCRSFAHPQRSRATLAPAEVPAYGHFRPGESATVGPSQTRTEVEDSDCRITVPGGGSIRSLTRDRLTSATVTTTALPSVMDSLTVRMTTIANHPLGDGLLTKPHSDAA
jgi:hypothetical protein